MTNKIDVETLLKHYSEGRISKQEFLYLHSLITQPQPQSQHPSYVKPSQDRSLMVLPPELNSKNHGVFHFVKTYHKSIVAFMGSLSILSTLAFNYSSNLGAHTNKAESMAVHQSLDKNASSEPKSMAKKDINSVAEYLLGDPIWEARNVNQFTTQWIALSNAQKQIVQSSQLSRNIAREITPCKI